MTVFDVLARAVPAQAGVLLAAEQPVLPVADAERGFSLPRRQPHGAMV